MPEAPSKTRILLVDDHALVRSGIAELISREPELEVCGEAKDASLALRLAREKEPHLAIIDLSLREGSGMELLKQLHVEKPSIKLLVCSMHDEDLYAERALRSGAMGYVSKQAPSADMIKAIRTVLDGRVYASERLVEHVLSRVSSGAHSPEDSPLKALSDRELEVLSLLGKGLSTREIAEHLNLSTKTIDTYREHLKSKLDLQDVHELLRFAVAWTLDPSGGPEA
jgi:DNA-binding NarL/FixJ family response regulator